MPPDFDVNKFMQLFLEKSSGKEPTFLLCVTKTSFTPTFFSFELDETVRYNSGRKKSPVFRPLMYNAIN